MFYSINKLFLALIFNLSLFLILMIGIQNSSTKSKVNLLLNETIELPNSFIIGISFITGSFFGNILPLNFFYRKK